MLVAIPWPCAVTVVAAADDADDAADDDVVETVGYALYIYSIQSETYNRDESHNHCDHFHVYTFHYITHSHSLCN